MNKVTKWLRKNYSRITESIAFFPVIIAIAFLLLSWFMLELDYSQTGKNIKSDYSWIKLRDASTARSVVSTIAGGIISLTVFSFSMVMILLNQAASQMSNRMLEGMISNRFQQIILGFYIGSIVYALFLLSGIRDVDSGIYIPALSIYLLLILTVGDIFLFIYFLHYVTQTVKFETIIEKVHRQTLRSLAKSATTTTEETQFALPPDGVPVFMPESGYYQGFDKEELIAFARKHKGLIRILYPAGSYLLKGTPLVTFYGETQLLDKETFELVDSLDLYIGQPVEKNPYYGFHQLAEVAIKALSPGINDPETAVLSIHALTDLFVYKLSHFDKSVYADDDNHIRIKTTERSFTDLFKICFDPVWDYGKNDRYIQSAMLAMLGQLTEIKKEGGDALFLLDYKIKISRYITENVSNQPK